MVHKFSPADFGNLINESVSAINEADFHVEESCDSEASSDVQPKKMSFDDFDSSDDLDNLDVLDDLDDLDNLDNPENDSLLDDIDDLNDFDSTDTEDNQTSTSTTTEISQAIDITKYIKTKSLGECPDSIIPNYASDIHIQPCAKSTVVDSMFSLFLQKFEDSYLVTSDCNNYADLWNKNFPAGGQCQNVQALDRLLAMFFNISLISQLCVEKLLAADNAEAVLKLQALGRIASMEDVMIALGEMPSENRSHNVVEKEQNATEEASSNAETETLPVDTTEQDITLSIGEVNEEAATHNEETATKKHTKRKFTTKLRKVFTETAYRELLPDNVKARFESITLLRNSFNSLKDRYQTGVISEQEFIQFLLFLAQTREIILSPDILNKVETFNKYTVCLLANTLGVDYQADRNYSSVIIVVGKNGVVNQVFSEHLLLNWRLYQLSMTKRSALKLVESGGVTYPVLILDNNITAQKFVPKNLTSNAAEFAEYYLEHFNAAIDAENEDTDEVSTNIGIDSSTTQYFCYHKLGKEIPESNKVLTRFQRANFDIVTQYLKYEQPALLDAFLDGKTPSLLTLVVTKLSSNRALAFCQIITHLFRKEAKATLNTEFTDTNNIDVSTIHLKGDGVPEGLLIWSVETFLHNIVEVLEHARLSTSVKLVTEGGNFSIIFNK